MKKSILDESETIDNGGAVAINGFNYQAAVIMLIALLNYKKKDFSSNFSAYSVAKISLNRHFTLHFQFKFSSPRC